MGYAYSTEALIGIAAYTPIALNTALTFLVLSLGVLFSLQRRGLMAILSGDGPGSVIARRLLPPMIVIPFALGWMRLRAQRLGLFGTEFGVAILVTFTILILTGVVWKAALVLNRTEAARKEAAEALARRTESWPDPTRSWKSSPTSPRTTSGAIAHGVELRQLLARRYHRQTGFRRRRVHREYAVDGAGRMQRLITDLWPFRGSGGRARNSSRRPSRRPWTGLFRT
jgi:hypothetical protein